MFNVGDTVKIYDDDKPFAVAKGKVIVDMNKHNEYIVSADEKEFLCNEKNLARAYTHLSPTGLALFETNREEFYMKYMARYKPSRIPQTAPMSVGSAFDAYVKSYIVTKLRGVNNVPKQFEFPTIFKQQVEEHNREWALKAGLHCFECYKNSGALADLMLEINTGDSEPRFEFEMKGLVHLENEHVPITGKPDLYFVNRLGARVVSDWKVNGYCSNSPVSPKPQYVMCRDSWPDSTAKRSKNDRQAHKDAFVQMCKGIMVNVACKFEQIDYDWATQIATYAWLMGEPVGSDFICGLEQLACKPGGVNLGFGVSSPPLIRVASFRSYIGKEFQLACFNRYKDAWEIINSDHFFRNMSRSDSLIRCEQLEKVSLSLRPTGNAKEDWFSTNCR